MQVLGGDWVLVFEFWDRERKRQHCLAGEAILSL